ncbi:hypothetical protein [Halomonas sp. H10-9-1]
MAASHQQRYRQRRQAQGFKEVTVSIERQLLWPADDNYCDRLP